MCKQLLKGLLGGGGTAAAPAAQPVGNVDTVQSDAQVKNSDLLTANPGGDPSGRIKLNNGAKKGQATVAGLSL